MNSKKKEIFICKISVNIILIYRKLGPFNKKLSCLRLKHSSNLLIILLIVLSFLFHLLFFFWLPWLCNLLNLVIVYSKLDFFRGFDKLKWKCACSILPFKTLSKQNTELKKTLPAGIYQLKVNNRSTRTSFWCLWC